MKEKNKELTRLTKTLISKSNKIIESYFDFDIYATGKDKGYEIKNVSTASSLEELQILCVWMMDTTQNPEELHEFIQHVKENIGAEDDPQFETWIMGVVYDIITVVTKDATQKITELGGMKENGSTN